MEQRDGDFVDIFTPLNYLETSVLVAGLFLFTGLASLIVGLRNCLFLQSFALERLLGAPTKISS